MITVLRADIICDKCGDGYPLPSHQKMTHMRRWAKGMGWDCTTSKDFCPSCNPYRKQNPPLEKSQ